MEVAITKVSSKGQVVIPAEIKKAMGINEGDKLLAIALDESVLLVKVPKNKLLDIVKPLWAKVRELGLTEEKVNALIEEAKTKGRAR